ncbi:MAG: hypothetical protein ABIR24_07170 [Verrucomicrobiota bacterium]
MTATTQQRFNLEMNFVIHLQCADCGVPYEKRKISNLWGATIELVPKLFRATWSRQ